jgi:GNAT superfamily N-acetyltransferase
LIKYCIAENIHLPQILELYKQLQPGEEPLKDEEADKILEKIDQHNIKYFVAIDDGKVISSCYLAIIPNLTRNGRSNGLIENVITDKNYRKKGIGKNILDMAVKYAKEHSCYKVILQSSYSREENHIFYEKCGFDGNSKRAFELRF